MTDFEEIIREVIKHNLGEVRLDEICEQCGLSIADKELVNELLSKWKPDYTLAELVALSKNYKDRSNNRQGCACLRANSTRSGSGQRATPIA